MTSGDRRSAAVHSETGPLHSDQFGDLVWGRITGDVATTRSRRLAMLGIYFFLKLMLFFAIVKALVKFETLGDHFLFLGLIYTSLVAFISYVFVVSTQQVNFQADWVIRVSRSTGLSPWLSWLAATLVLSTLYFKLISKFDEGILFWILLFLGIPLVFF